MSNSATSKIKALQARIEKLENQYENTSMLDGKTRNRINEKIGQLEDKVELVQNLQEEIDADVDASNWLPTKAEQQRALKNVSSLEAQIKAVKVYEFISSKK